MKSIDASAAETILGPFCEVNHQHIDYDLFETVKDYKLRIASKFKSIGRKSIDKIQGNEFYISLKLDGEHSQLFFEDGEAALLRPRGYAYLGLPILDKAAEILQKAGVKRALIPGELYVKRPDGARTRVFDVITYTKSPKSAEDLDLLSFAPFDIIFLDDESFVDYQDVLKRLETLFGDTDAAPAPTHVSNSVKDIHHYYDQWVNKDGAEGLMIRSDFTFRYKLKAQHTIDAVIIGYTAENDMVTSVLTALIDDEGNVQVLTAVEKGFSDIDRMDLYQKLSQSRCESYFMEVSRFHTPFYMVHPKIIIEFGSNDMVAEANNGRPIKKAALRLKDGKYRLVKSRPFVSLRHCVFIRFRDDKAVNPVDLRTAQVTDYIFIDLTETPTQDIRFPEVEVLIRDVYIKEAKGQTAIRKIVVWKTNKEAIDSSYSAYALNYTDYSAGRKDPLKQDVRISNSRHQILELAKEFRDKNIKKGWVLYKPEAEAKQADLD